MTPSGMFTLPPFLLTLQIMGADRIMYAVDYPFIAGDQARTFLEHAPISPADKEKIAHGNAEEVKNYLFTFVVLIRLIMKHNNTCFE